MKEQIKVLAVALIQLLFVLILNVFPHCVHCFTIAKLFHLELFVISFCKLIYKVVLFNVIICYAEPGCMQCIFSGFNEPAT